MLISESKQKEVYDYLIADINYNIDNICIELLNDNINTISGKIETLKQLQCFNTKDLQVIRNKAREKLITLYKEEITGLTIDPALKDDPNIGLGYSYF